MSVSPSPASAKLEASKKAQAAGNYKAALITALEAFVTAPDAIAVQQHLVQLLGKTKGYKLPKAISDHLARVAATNSLDIQALATVVAVQMESNPQVDLALAALESEGQVVSIPEEQQQACTSIFTDSLLLLVLDQATAISPNVERLIVAARRRAIAQCLDSNDFAIPLWEQFPTAMAAIANQCFHTEYVFTSDDRDQALLQELKLKIADNLEGLRVADCIALAMYEPLLMALADLSDKVVAMVDASVEHWPDWATRVWTVQAKNPFLEATLRDELHAYTEISDGLSATVREQYERFPYPRWQVANVAQEKTCLAALLKQQLPKTDLPPLPDGPVNTLFAGCGTGKQVVELACSLSMDNVLAVDLSRTSLAYAQRKSAEHGLSHIHFGQADIMAIGSWDASFDLIVCTGVLHHMADPLAALRSLLAVSKPTTVMFLALYSERARSHVIAARQYITDHSVPDTIEGIRSFRETLRSLPLDHPVKPVAESREFYSASGLHDLVFNTHELRFTPLTLKALLAEAGLRFGGFISDRPEYRLLYQKRFPDDPAMTNLENWDLFETDQPDLFRGMMQFWCFCEDV